MLPYIYNFDDSGTKTVIPQVDTAPHGVETPTHWLVADWLRLVEHAARVAPRDNVEVPPHPGRIRSHLRIRNSSKYLQIERPGDDNGDPSGRYRPARCGSSNPTGRLMAGWCSSSQRAAIVALRANVEVPPHPRRIFPIPGSVILPNIYNSNNPGTKAEIPRVDIAARGVETPTLLTNC